MCFRSGEEDIKVPGPIADSCGYHIPRQNLDLIWDRETVSDERLLN